MTLKEERELKKAAKLEAEKQRIEAMREYEEMYDTFSYICGIDEAGRGPLAGPVVAGAVILPKGKRILYVNDSKKLSDKKRRELFDVICQKALSFGIAFATEQEIDRINIFASNLSGDGPGRVPIISKAGSGFGGWKPGSAPILLNTSTGEWIDPMKLVWSKVKAGGKVNLPEVYSSLF